MPQPEKRDICFSSADGKTGIKGFLYQSPTVAPRAILQIAHGMCEYIGRYEELAGFLCENGVALCGNDHLGHGGSVNSADDYGYFGPDGRQFVLEDLHTMNGLAREAFPGLPLVLLGHSMGSFYARKYATIWPESIDGLIICGTGGPNPLVGLGIFLSSLLAKLRGPRYRSKLIHNIAFGQYLKGIDSPKTPYDWISTDEAIVDTYAKDPLCTFRFTANGFHEMFSILQETSTAEWAAAMPKALPTYLVAGGADPVGNYGTGVEKVHLLLQHADLEDLDCKIYPAMRHEILNEAGREQVYADVLAFVQRCTAPA